MFALVRRTALALCLLWVLSATGQAAQWKPIGPDGGDVRSLAADPRDPDRILLGTSSGQIFVSRDGGATWSRFARLGDREHYVLDHIAFDPQHPGTIYVAAWSVENEGGDVFRSSDDGNTWQALPALHGKSIRAFALAPSDPRILVAGALDGVFRSGDAGATWQRISPENHPELKNVESLAIDPRSPDAIYVGTWHLPWKTSDGGLTWHSIKSGIIDDSDVFSIIIDPKKPSVVYASACSGIYRSESAGASFRKVQGIPYSARRTRVLQQDPIDPSVVYAGTTEGLWKTADEGKSWKRLSAANVIVNDVLRDARRPQRILLATDRGGVLLSANSGLSFAASNRGFTHRQVAALLVDRHDSNVLYAGLINDKDFGGVFVSRDAGQHWMQMNAGLAGHDIFSLRQAEDGTLLAGTNRGMFLLSARERRWQPIGTVLREVPAKPAKPGSRRPPPKATIASQLATRVADIQVAGGKWFAATSDGVFSSEDTGRSWRGGPVLGERDFIALRVAGKMVTAATPRSLMVSLDGGSTWYPAALPRYVTALYGVTIDNSSTLWLAARQGALRSSDGGDAWEHVLAGLPPKEVTSVAYDQEGKRLLATAETGFFESTDGGRNWRRIGESAWRLRGVSFGGGRVFATTDFNGIVAPPEPDSQPPSSSPASGAAGPSQ